MSDELESRRARLSAAQRAALLERLRGSAASEDRIPSAGREVTSGPLSLPQERLWRFETMVPGTTVYNESFLLRIEGSLPPALLEGALARVVEKHEIFRTTFAVVDGAPRQTIRPSIGVTLAVVDLKALSPSERALKADAVVEEAARRPFDLAEGPLCRFVLISLGPLEQLLFIGLHHIVFDGGSLDVLWRELGSAFGALLGGELPEPSRLRYLDFAIWQRARAQDDARASSLAYWTKRLEALPRRLELPCDHPRATQPSYRGGLVPLPVPAALGTRVRAMAARDRITTRSVLFAAFATLIYRYTGEQRFVVAVPVAGRDRRELEPLIGFFVNTLPFPIELGPQTSFAELARTTAELQLELAPHAEVPFEQIVHALGAQGDDSPLAQVMFAYRRSANVGELLPGVRLSCDFVHAGGALFDLNLIVDDSGVEFRVWLEYRRDRFEQATVERYGRHFLSLLESGVDSPDAAVAHLRMLAPAERIQLLEEFNGSAPPAFESVTSLILAQARAHPDETAIVDRSGALTYRELVRDATVLAEDLVRRGAAPDRVVAVRARRSRETIVAIFGVLMSGAAMLLVAADDPEERQRFMIEDSGALLVLDTDEIRAGGRLPAHDGPALAEPHPSHLAYLVYTSGSTGRPKGVALEHRGLSNVIRAHVTAYLLEPRMRVLQFFALSLDGAYSEVLGTLAAGAALYALPPEAIAPGAPLLETLRMHRIENVAVTPSALGLLPYAPLEDLRTIIVAGEACNQEVVDRWGTPRRRIINGYGPSEATIGATAGPCEPHARKPSIGRPLTGCRVYIRDTNGELVPIGVPGALCVGGIGVGRGYINLPELTAARFVADPFADSEGARMVLTGDRARWLPDGRIDFLGRADGTLKIRGFFVDPGEIEAVLREYIGVVEAVVLVHDFGPDDRRLVAYVTSRETPAPSAGALRALCRRKLPRYLIPNAFVNVPAMPSLPSGKIDREMLRAIPVRVDLAPDFLAPRTPQELRVALAFESALGVRAGARDDFFALGGHSFHAVRVAALLEASAGRRLTMRDLLTAPTVEELAARIDHGEGSAPSLPLVCLTDSPSGDPLYLVHAVGGGVACYVELARALAPDFAVFGLQADGLEGGAPLDDVRVMAGRYAGAILQAGRGRRHRVGGWSFGGVIALEVARCLQEAGEVVDAVVLFDATLGQGEEYGIVDNDRAALGAILREAARRAAVDTVGLDTALEEAPAETLFQRGLGWAERSGALPSGLGTDVLLRQVRALRANLRARDAYRPFAIQGVRVLFLEALESPRPRGWSRAEWSAHSLPPWTFEMAAGDHDSMLSGAGVADLATRVRGFIRDA